MNSQAVFFKYRTTTYISTLSLHDALPICQLLLQLRDHVRQRAALASDAAHRRGNHAGLLLAAQPERRRRDLGRVQAQHDAQPNIHFPHGGQLLAQILHRRGEGGSLLAVLDRLGPQGLELPDLPAPGDILDEEESFQDNRDHGREQQHADGAPLDAEPARARGRARKDDNMEFMMRLLTHPYSSRRARQSYEV